MISRRTVLKQGLLFLGVAGRSIVPWSANAQSGQNSETDWQPLSEDVSRAELFQGIVEPDRATSDAALPSPLVAFPFKGYFKFPGDAAYDDIAKKARTDEIFGVDLSHYSSASLDVRSLKQQGITFAYVKATQGTKFKDEKFGTFWNSLGGLPPARKVYRGAYHFLSAGVDGEKQADRFVDYVNLHGGFAGDDLVPCVDLEWDVSKSNPDAWMGTDPAEIIGSTLSFLKRVEARTSRRPLIYTARSWWHSVTAKKPATRSNFERLADYRIWIADYSKSNRAAETPFVPLDRSWLLWQFTATSGLDTGYPSDGFLDASVYKGSLAQFKSDFGI